jgi:tRNA-modifying protein YgfZ
MSEPLVTSPLADWLRPAAAQTPPSSPTPSTLPTQIARRSDWALISVTGNDATPFLHGQLTHDVQLLAAGGARWTALCSAKGRVLASMLLVKHAPDQIELVVMADVAETLVKRLKMFVLRAKVAIAVNPERAIWTVSRAAPLGMSTWASQQLEPDQTAVALLGAGANSRVAVIGRAADAPTANAADLAHAQAQDIESVWAWVGAAMSDQHVPQMLNYESIDGISFKKGCYPGQEVVARSQFRGAIKRRCYAVRSEGAMAVGDEVWTASAPPDSVGVVLQSCAGWGLVVVQQAPAELAMRSGGDLMAGPADGAKTGLQLQTLPYGLRDDI